MIAVFCLHELKFKSQHCLNWIIQELHYEGATKQYLTKSQNFISPCVSAGP